MKHPLDYFCYCPRCGSKNFSINDEKSKRCLKCGFVFYINPSSAVAAFIEDEDGKLLVCIRSKDPKKGTFDLPGGFADIGDTLEIAMKREIKEELNLELKSLKYMFSIANNYIYSGFDVPTLDSFFSCKVKDLNEIKAGDDVCDYLWLDKEYINEKKFGLGSIRKAVKRWKIVSKNNV